MEDFATYILSEKNYIQKMIITYYLSKKTGIFFDKSVVLKTEIAKLFIRYMKIDVDLNEILTAMLLCNCKKVDNMQKMGRLETYAQEGAEYLKTLGFSSKFCKMCEEVNRYNDHEVREDGSDILEVVDQFTGLILNRVERGAFPPTEAMMILKERNLKYVDNKYLDLFDDFVEKMENIYIKEVIDVPILKKLVSIHNREANVKTFIAALGNKYSAIIEKTMQISPEKQKKEYMSIEQRELMESIKVKNKALFSKEVAERIMNHKSNFKVEE
ncbi:MAG: hypothetical protein HFJ17_00090 [Clostridia bacterium]|nr:hypothetical protein [Clostridia bacterium]